MRAICSILTIGLLLIISSAATAQDAMPWASSLESAKQLAAQKNQLVMVHFWAPNCPPCRMLDATLFKDPAFAAAVTKDYVPVKINAAEQTEIANQYGVDRWPQDVIILPSGQMVYRMVSKQEKDKAQYLAVLHGVAIKTAGMSQLASTAAPEAKPVSYPGEAAAPSGSYSRFGAAPAATEAAAAPQGQSRFSMPPAASTYSQNDATAPAAAPSQPTQSRFSTGGYAAAPTSESTPQPSGYSAGPAAGSQYAAASAPTQPSPQAQPSTPPPTQSRFAAQPGGSSYGQPSQYNQPPTQPAPQAQPQDRFAAQPAAQPQSQYASQSTPRQSQFASQSRQPAAAPAATAAPQAQPQPQQSQQPEFALDGFCPVTLAEGMKWQKGDARWGAVHQGRVYLFASDVQQRKFLASPDRFSPVLSGNDPVAYIEQGRLVDGNRSHGLTYNGVLYLFSSEDNLKTFWSAPQRYAAQVQQAMLRNSQQLR